ncbi:hypothetical protein KsCSTR_42180 [Candidatus Kuenenia stuttgartiensis]|uniref:Uncharacterized protein n=1 Tax=Kuenenia stuttgartiensis TaxID=174633 RepID=Q1PXG3_KUEST|nr:hypothetical protein KsCSTR_42180 [Candidatus Kuenenia stuttgartiensis]CAJ71918.1 unknown protein [Candidatus Kuenenia stuttgartiensis]
MAQNCRFAYVPRLVVQTGGYTGGFSPSQVRGTVKLLIDKILFPVIRMARLRKNYRLTSRVYLRVKIVKRQHFSFLKKLNKTKNSVLV